MNKIATRPRVDPVSDEAKIYGRAITRVQVASAIWALWDRMRQEQGVDQQWLADRMGKDKSWASRLLKGPGNWTLDTVGEILEAMGGRLTLVEAHTYDEIAQGKAAKRQRPRVGRMIIKIEAEIDFDGPDRPDANELSWEPMAAVRTFHRLAKPIEEQAEVS